MQLFTFENIHNSNIVITIVAMSLKDAVEILNNEFKAPENYKQIFKH